MTTPAIDLTAVELPPRAAEIVELVGAAAALALFERYGGVRVYVPVKLDASHPLARLMGLQPARALAERFGGEYLDVPKAAVAARASRDAGIVTDHAGGQSVRNLALQHGLTERRIYRILATSGTVVDERQTELFPSS